MNGLRLMLAILDFNFHQKEADAFKKKIIAFFKESFSSNVINYFDIRR